MKSLTLTLLTFIISLSGISQLTYVPDDNFEHFIETFNPNASNGVVNDNYVLTSGLDLFGVLVFTVAQQGGLDVSDLTGIEDFKKLRKISFISSSIVNIDLSNVTLITPFNYDDGILISGCNYLQSAKLPHGEYVVGIINNPYLSHIEFPSDFISRNCEIQGCNSLTSLDMSSISDVILNSRLKLYANNLNCIKLNNGKCNKWANVEIKYNNLMLTCVQVDNPSFCQIGENVNTWDWDGYNINSNQYSTNCNCITGLEEQKNSNYNLTPNPTSSEVKIKINPNQLGKTFTLFDNIGREKMRGVFNSTEYILNLERFEPGIYLLKPSDEDAQIKIVKN